MVLNDNLEILSLIEDFDILNTVNDGVKILIEKIKELLRKIKAFIERLFNKISNEFDSTEYKINVGLIHLMEALVNISEKYRNVVSSDIIDLDKLLSIEKDTIKLIDTMGNKYRNTQLVSISGTRFKYLLMVLNTIVKDLNFNLKHIHLRNDEYLRRNDFKKSELQKILTSIMNMVTSLNNVIIVVNNNVQVVTNNQRT